MKNENFYTFLKVIQTADKGRGVVSSVRIPKGSLVCPANGTILQNDQIQPNHLCLQIGDEQWLCSEGNFIDDFFNHSCQPNIGFLDGSLTYFALKDIEMGEELCWDYSTSLTESGWTLTCACNHLACRKIIHSFFDLDKKTQIQLAPISLNYIRKRFYQDES